MQTISDLWNGNLAPCAHCGSHDPEANRLLTLLERNRESLYKGLTQEQKDAFQKYIDWLRGVSASHGGACFLRRF